MVHPSSSVLHIFKSTLNLNSPDVTKFKVQHCLRNVTTRFNIARDLNSTAILDLPTSRVPIFHKRKQQIFYVS